MAQKVGKRLGRGKILLKTLQIAIAKGVMDITHTSGATKLISKNDNFLIEKR